MTNTNTRDVYPIAELSMAIVGDNEHIGQLLNGEFDEVLLIDTFNGGSINLEIAHSNIQSLILYDSYDAGFEHTLVDDRLRKMNRENLDYYMEREKGEYRTVFTVGKYALLDKEDRFNVVTSFLVFDDKAFQVSAKFSYKLVSEYCGGTKTRLVEIIEEVVSFCENIRK